MASISKSSVVSLIASTVTTDGTISSLLDDSTSYYVIRLHELKIIAQDLIPNWRVDLDTIPVSQDGCTKLQ